MERRQLYKFAHSAFEKFALYDDKHGISTRRAASLPFVHWPNGAWCLEANLFLSSLLEKGYAHEPRGGTLGTYSSYLSRLVRHVHAEGKQFSEISDGEFGRLVGMLYDEQHPRKGVSQTALNRSSVRALVSVWLEFLNFVAELIGDPGLVGPEGRIRARRETKTIGANARISVSTWTHWSLGPDDPSRKLMPMSEATLKSLREAVSLSSGGTFQKRRRLTMLELFDAVGLRRREASRLKLKHVLPAIRDFEAWKLSDLPGPGAFFIDIPLVKQADRSQERLRVATLSAVSVQFFAEYVERLRAVAKRILKRELTPEDPFFVNLRPGLGFGTACAPNFFTKEYSHLAEAARLVGVVCNPHSARRRFIVRELVRLLKAHSMNNKDDFRRALVNMEGFKERLRQITGHARVESLEPYLNFALDELTSMAETIALVDAQRGVDALTAASDRFTTDMKQGADPSAAAWALHRSVRAFTGGAQSSQRVDAQPEEVDWPEAPKPVAE